MCVCVRVYVVVLLVCKVFYIGDDKFIGPNMRTTKIDGIEVVHVKLNYRTTNQTMGSSHIILAPRFLILHPKFIRKSFFLFILTLLRFCVEGENVLISKNCIINCDENVGLLHIHIDENYPIPSQNFTFMMYAILKKR